MKFTEFIETIKLAGESMRGNKMRSFLAALGVVIGISFVILTGWIISGLDNALEETINLIGQDMIYIDKWDWTGGKNWKLYEARKDITLKQAEEFCSRMKGAELAVPLVRKWAITIKAGNDSYDGISALGTRYTYSQTSAASIQEGRFFSIFEDQINTNVIVLGSKVAETLFPEGNALDKTVIIRGQKFEVIGIVKKQGTMLMDFVDNQVFLPVGAFMDVFGGQMLRSAEVGIKVGNMDNIDEIREEARGIMREIRNLQYYQDDDFSLNETKAFEETVASLRAYVWGIGIGLTMLSFIVGIIGIMNIMFVSVAERTREIGIRKAIGAKKASILMQFIVESAALCFFGAVISFVLCSTVIYLAATFLPKVWEATAFLKPVMPFQFLILGSVVSIIVGILAGLIPAMRAAKLDPVDSLRYE
jgi:putative ABC transport system permease protein